jgi:hypothetical protein
MGGNTIIIRVISIGPWHAKKEEGRKVNLSYEGAI